MNLQFLTWREWRSRPGRSVLTVLSVAVAVAAALGTAWAQSAVRRAYREINAALEGPPELEIVARQGGRFPLYDMPSLASLDDVASVTPLLFRATIARATGKSWRTVVTGIDDRSAAGWSRLQLTHGRLPKSDGEALIAANLAESLQLKFPQRVMVLAKRGFAAISVVGAVSQESFRKLEAGASLAMPLATAHRIFGSSGQVDCVRIEVDSANRREALASQIASQLPKHLTVQMPASRMRLADEVLRSTELALQFAGALALAMAGFIILNTLRMNFSERRRQFAMMRAIGASAPQIRSLVLREAWIIGCLGVVVGLPLGLVLAFGVSRAMHAILGHQVPLAWPGFWAVALGIAIGPAVALVAAWFPAREALRLSPLEGIADVDSGSGDSYPRRAIVISLLIWFAALGLLLLVVRETLPGDVAVPAGLAMMCAYILLIPAVLGAIVAAVAALSPRFLQADALVAQRQIQRRRLRSTITVGVLVIAINSGLGLGHAIFNNVDDVQTWYRRTVSGDYVLRQLNVQSTTDPISNDEAAVKEIRSVNGVTGVTTVRFRSARVQGEPVMCIIRELVNDQVLPWNLTAEQESSVRQKLAAGQALISSVVARQLQLAPGETLRLEIQGRNHAVSVAAIVSDYNSGGLAVFLDRHAAAKMCDLGSADLFVIACENGQAEGAQQPLLAIGDRRGLVLQSFADLRQNLDRLIGGITGALFALLALGFVVGGFGVANTLTMSLLEQTRELALLRVIGMSQRQLGRLMFVESLILGIASAILGVLGGMTTAIVIHWCNKALLDRDVPFQFRGDLLVVNVVACLLVVLIAAWLPGRRAARLDLLPAISYE